MHRWTWPLLVLSLAVGAGAGESEPGRTDGPEESEYGKGGYSLYKMSGQFYLDGYFGSATVDIEPEEGEDLSETDLFYGLSAGYQIEDWLGFQLGYGYIADQKINLYSAGILNSFNLEPFNYFLSLEAEIYSPDKGSSKFGLVPGVGAEVVLSDHIRAGLRFQHDFIFSDDNISINRFSARLQFKF